MASKIPRLDRQELINMLERLARQEISIEDADREAYYITETLKGKWNDVYDSDPLSIPTEVVNLLLCSDWMLITYRDAPFLISLLKTKEGYEAEAMQRRMEYFSDERWYQRRQEILGELGPSSWYALPPDFPKESR